MNRKRDIEKTKQARFAFFLSVLFCMLWNAPASASGGVHLVWSQADGAGNYDVYYAHGDGRTWGAPVRLTERPEVDTLPAVAEGPGGTLWVVWSVIGSKGSGLSFCRFDGVSWSAPAAIESGLAENTAPVVLVDGAGDPWVAWSGSDGADDDIFVVRFRDGTWSLPVRVNADDAAPDIFPALELDSEDAVRVTWQGLEGTEYRSFESRFTGVSWTPEALIRDAAASAEREAASALFRDLPGYVAEKAFAGMQFQTASGHRFVRFHETAAMAENGSQDSPVIEETAAESILLLTLGDSITVGFPYYTGAMDGSTKGGYQPSLSSRLDGPSQTVTVLNYGVSGENTTQGLSRLNGILSRHSTSRMMLILEGTNDIFYFSRSTTYANWRKMVDICLGRRITPVLATLTPDTRPIMDGMKAVNTTYNVEIRKIVTEKNIPLCELYNPLRSDWNEAYTEDGLHPNRNGYRAMAQIWFDSVKTPEVMTLNASSVGETDAVIDGVVNPKHFPLTYYFEYGYDTNYGGKTDVLDGGSGNSPLGVSASLANLSDNTVYHFRLVAENDYGLFAGNDMAFQTLESPSENCFIATAAFGSPFEPQVKILRAFRDQFLLPFSWGRYLVEFYYDISPALARTIADHEGFKTLVRTALYPVVGVCYAAMHPLDGRVLFGGGVLLMLGGLFGYGVYRRRTRP